MRSGLDGSMGEGEPGGAGVGGRGSDGNWGHKAMVITGLAYGGAMVVSLFLLLRGAGVVGGPPREALLSAGLIGLLLVLTMAPAAIIVALWAWTSPVRELSRRLRDVQDAVRVISEQAALSDDARRVLNRSTEREMLRRAIEQDIEQREWEAAVVLCDELANRFGYRADAEELRAKIAEARAGELDAAVREGAALIDGMLLQRRWADAEAEAARLARLMPQQTRTRELAARVEQARSEFKAEARQRFVAAAAEGRVEDAMTLLRDLDGLLTESESLPLRDMARGVIARAREQLGTQFREAIDEQDWADAATIARRIIAEHPNTKMAAEARQMLDGILARANAVGQPAR